MAKRNPSRNVNVGLTYQKAGAAFFKIRSDQRIFTYLDIRHLVHLLVQRVEQQQNIPANDIYDLLFEVIELATKVVSKEHIRTGRINPDLVIEKDRIDELGNESIKKIFPRAQILVADPIEIAGLQQMLLDCVSLKRNRRPGRSRMIQIPVPQGEAKSGIKHSRRKRISTKPSAKRRAFFNAMHKKSTENVFPKKDNTKKVYSSQPWYYYIG